MSLLRPLFAATLLCGLSALLSPGASLGEEPRCENPVLAKEPCAWDNPSPCPGGIPDDNAYAVTASIAGDNEHWTGGYDSAKSLDALEVADRIVKTLRAAGIDADTSLRAQDGAVLRCTVHVLPVESETEEYQYAVQVSVLSPWKHPEAGRSLYVSAWQRLCLGNTPANAPERVLETVDSCLSDFIGARHDRNRRTAR